MHDESPSRPGTEHDWLDRDAGPLVRAYTVTGGRVRPAAGGIDLMAFVAVAATAGSVDEQSLQPEHRAILIQVRQPVAVAELASHLDLAIGVVRVLLGDLLQQGLITMYEPQADSPGSQSHVLKAVIDGLRAL